MRVAFEHLTRYCYDRPVLLSPHWIRLHPAAHGRTPVSDFSLEIQPQPQALHWQQDPFNNHVARAVFAGPTRELAFKVSATLDLAPLNPFDFFLEPYAANFPFEYPPDLLADLALYTEREAAGAHFAEFLAHIDMRTRNSISFLVELNQQLRRAVAYTVRWEPGIQAPETTLRHALGSCRDSTWLLVQVLRHIGLAARFVSGYLVQLFPAPEVGTLPSKDRLDLHAWAEVYLPGAGWIGLDPTSGLLASEGHIPLACTAHPRSAAPIVGSTENCEVSFHVSHKVRRLADE